MLYTHLLVPEKMSGTVSRVTRSHSSSTYRLSFTEAVAAAYDLIFMLDRVFDFEIQKLEFLRPMLRPHPAERPTAHMTRRRLQHLTGQTVESVDALSAAGLEGSPAPEADDSATDVETGDPPVRVLEKEDPQNDDSSSATDVETKNPEVLKKDPDSDDSSTDVETESPSIFGKRDPQVDASEVENKAGSAQSDDDPVARIMGDE